MLVAQPTLVSDSPGASSLQCFWFNNGCDISCNECDGRTGQVIHPRFLNDDPDTFPSWAGEHLRPNRSWEAVNPNFWAVVALL